MECMELIIPVSFAGLSKGIVVDVMDTIRRWESKLEVSCFATDVRKHKDTTASAENAPAKTLRDTLPLVRLAVTTPQKHSVLDPQSSASFDEAPRQ